MTNLGIDHDSVVHEANLQFGGSPAKLIPDLIVAARPPVFYRVQLTPFPFTVARFETRSLPTLARCFPRSFTFYVADPSAALKLVRFPRSLEKSEVGRMKLSHLRQPAFA